MKKTKFTLSVSTAAIGLLSIHSAMASDFDRAIRPMTNLTQHDLAIPQNQIRGIYMNHKFPDRVTLANNTEVPFGGDLNLFALQAEFALSERLSIVALKDGYIDFNPDDTFTGTQGFANLAAGLKYAYILDHENSTALSGIASIEIPTGESEVFQGQGDGALNLILSGLKFYGDTQISVASGLHIPFSDSESFTGFVSAHASYHHSKAMIPFIELNWYTTLQEGDGSFDYSRQLGTTVSQNVNFEGGDLINFGAANGGDNDLVTLGLGFQSQLTDTLTSGLVYEIPLTESESSLYESRFTATLNLKF